MIRNSFVHLVDIPGGNQQIFPASKPPAPQLHVHERTVAKKVSSILQKFHLANRTQAALYAVREGVNRIAR
ncbi:MAG: hypothetical protein FD151_1883 [bacterium]|nr:MAG: hypothetical protein FD151_1883 [bacterium]